MPARSEGRRPTDLAPHGNDVSRAAAHFGISRELMQWRVNATTWRAGR
jgi:hypothetical protein